MLYRNLNSFWPDSNATVNKKPLRQKKISAWRLVVCMYTQFLETIVNICPHKSEALTFRNVNKSKVRCSSLGQCLFSQNCLNNINDITKSAISTTYFCLLTFQKVRFALYMTSNYNDK